jgi:hypothetical protein
MAYASKRVPEIADSLVDIDNAMKWGFAWEMGPFETWDALGVKATVARLEGEGVSVAPWVKQMLAAGKEQFLHLRRREDRWSMTPLRKDYVEVDARPQSAGDEGHPPHAQGAGGQRDGQPVGHRRRRDAARVAHQASTRSTAPCSRSCRRRSSGSTATPAAW